MQSNEQDAYIAALEWHLEQGADEQIAEQAVTDRFQKLRDVVATTISRNENAPQQYQQPDRIKGGDQAAVTLFPDASKAVVGSPQFKQQAIDIVSKIKTLEELSQAIQHFDGLDVKKTATNFVFADGNPNAKLMLIGEAPGADEDRAGKPFVGVSGQLLDKILACIDIDRAESDPHKSIYISNVLNWRPPGNRTPTPQEMEISLPFIEKHIALINPDYLLFCGGVAAQTLLHTKESISRLRGKMHDFQPQTISAEKPIKALATYHPAYLLRTPSQKAKVWQDMLFLQKMRRDN